MVKYNDINHLLYYWDEWMSELDRILKSIEKARLASEKKTQNTNALAESDPLHEIVDNTVTKSHALSRAYYRFGIVEKRCMEALISKLNPLRGDNSQEIELLATEYAAAFPDAGKHAYEHLEKAGDALVSITESITAINDMNTQVATAAEEQSQVTQDINRNVVNMSELVNQNVTGISQSASASNELSKLAEQQKEQLAFFKL